MSQRPSMSDVRPGVPRPRPLIAVCPRRSRGVSGAAHEQRLLLDADGTRGYMSTARALLVDSRRTPSKHLTTAVAVVDASRSAATVAIRG